MFSEKTRLTDKRETPFYGSYKEQSRLEEVHWQNRKKKQQLTIVSVVVVILIVLAIGITLAITLPPILDSNSNRTLNPPDPDSFLGPSPSILGQYNSAGVSSQSSICSEIGKNILKESQGSAVDAAIAMALCIGVVVPQSSGLGGGLMMTIYDPDTEQMYAVNARETAPSGVDQLDDSTGFIAGGISVGIPGELAGLYEAHFKFGQLPWSDLVKLPRELAQNGFPVDFNLAKSLQQHSARIKRDEALSSEFLNPITGEVWLEGDVMNRPRLASTLQIIEQSGINEFYNGTIARDIEEEISASDGIITVDDLSEYAVEWQEPFSYKFKNNLTIFGPTFPSSAPIVTMALLILDGYGRKHPSDMSTLENVSDVHNLAETLKFTSVHRAQIADPQFVDLSNLLDDVLSPDYADELRSRIEPYRSFNDPTYYGAIFAETSDSGTAHISVIGPDGDAVSLTTTINVGFGAGFMGNKTGLIYNNQMNDFSVANQTDVYGLPPNHNNFAQPGKRPASSMAPLIFLNDKGQPVLATGGAGGSRILPAVITTTWRALYRDMDIKTAIDYPRFTTNFNPPELVYEYGLPAPLVSDLERRGHHMRRLNLDKNVGNVNAVCRTRRSSLILANADYRKRGSSAGF